LYQQRLVLKYCSLQSKALIAKSNLILEKKKGFSALCIFDIGGDEKIRTSDPGFAQMLP